jgi:hypothetical protein
MLSEVAKPDAELVARWELSLYQSMIVALDFGFIIMSAASSRHGLARLEKLQSAIRLRDIVLEVSSSPTLNDSHRIEVGKRVAELSAGLRSLGEMSIRSVPTSATASLEPSPAPTSATVSARRASVDADGFVIFPRSSAHL